MGTTRIARGALDVGSFPISTSRLTNVALRAGTGTLDDLYPETIRVLR